MKEAVEVTNEAVKKMAPKVPYATKLREAVSRLKAFLFPTV